MDKKEAIGNGKNGHLTAVHEWNAVDERGRHKNSQEIESDIEETRHSMDMIFDALSGRANPNTMYRRALHYLENTTNRENVSKYLSNISDRISGSFQRNPLPVMMIAAGAAWMLWETQHDERSHDGRTGAQIQRVKGETREQMQQMKRDTREQFNSARGKAGEFSGNVRNKAAEISGKAGEKLINAKEKAETFLDETHQRGEEYPERTAELRDTSKQSLHRADVVLHDNPLLFGFAAALAGSILGMLIPETKNEQNHAGENTDGVIQRIKNRGSEISAETTRAATETKEETKDTAERLAQKTNRTTDETGKALQSKLKEGAEVSVPPGETGYGSDVSMKKNEEKSPLHKESGPESAKKPSPPDQLPDNLPL